MRGYPRLRCHLGDLLDQLDRVEGVCEALFRLEEAEVLLDLLLLLLAAPQRLQVWVRGDLLLAEVCSGEELVLERGDRRRRSSCCEVAVCLGRGRCELDGVEGWSFELPVEGAYARDRGHAELVRVDGFSVRVEFLAVLQGCGRPVFGVEGPQVWLWFLPGESEVVSSVLDDGVVVVRGTDGRFFDGFGSDDELRLEEGFGFWGFGVDEALDRPELVVGSSLLERLAHVRREVGGHERVGVGREGRVLVRGRGERFEEVDLADRRDDRDCASLD